LKELQKHFPKVQVRSIVFEIDKFDLEEKLAE